MKNANSTALKIPGWYIEFQAALLRQAPRPEEIDQVTAEGWVNNQKSLKNNLAGCLIPSPVTVTTKSPQSNFLLEFVGTVVIPATTIKFVAKDKFVINTKRNAPVKISYVGGNFTEWFLCGDGKIEYPISKQTLRYAKLSKASVDGSIIEELGGEAKAETTLFEMFSLMEEQGCGEDGVLLNNSCVNIFYIRDYFAGVLRTVCIHWIVDGWRVYAGFFEYPHGYRAGDLVFSRNSVLISSETSAPAQAWSLDILVPKFA